MIEVFIPFSEATNSIQQLGWTLEAWDTTDKLTGSRFEPVALQVKNPSNEKMNHVAAEAIAKGGYIIAELGSCPEKAEGWKRYLKGQGIKVQTCQPRVH